MEASLNDAVCNVRQLETINLPDEQPQIEAPPASVTYISNFDTNFEDSKAFITCVSKYLEEADVHKGLVGVTYLRINEKRNYSNRISFLAIRNSGWQSVEQ